MQSLPVYKNPKLAVVLAALILFPAAFNRLAAQLTSVSADKVDSLAYPVKEGKDPFFIFYQANQVLKTGDLRATLPGNDSYSFEWSRYNPDLPGFDTPFQSDANLPFSSVSGLETGGYQVRIFNATGTDTSIMAWVMLDRLHARVHKTDEGMLDPSYRDCFRLALAGFVEEDTLVYYDPVDHLLLSQAVDYSFIWTSDNEDLKIPNDTIILRPNITYSPPYEDTWYILTVRDALGMVEVDSVFYESIQTKAKFRVSYLNKYSGEYDSTLTGDWSEPDFEDWSNSPASTDATLNVRFTNESLNGARFEWVFLDTTGGIRETATTYSLEEMPDFTYEAADKDYYPTLLSISEEGCEDSVTIATEIHVQKVELLIPNVFSPNGDHINDFWMFKHQSIKNCEITIVNRSGKVVYKKKIDNMYDPDEQWLGWNGNINGESRKAPVGQYYYVVKALGYDGMEYSDPTVWSQMKIFGGSGNNTGGSAPPGGTDPEAGLETQYTGWLYLYR